VTHNARKTAGTLSQVSLTSRQVREHRGDLAAEKEIPHLPLLLRRQVPTQLADLA